MIIGTEITESLSVLLILYTEELKKSYAGIFRNTQYRHDTRMQKKQDPQVLL